METVVQDAAPPGRRQEVEIVQDAAAAWGQCSGKIGGENLRISIKNFPNPLFFTLWVFESGF